MEPNPLSDLLDPRQAEKRVKQAMETSQKAASALVKTGVAVMRTVLGAAATAVKPGASCPECEGAHEHREHSDIKNYVCPPTDVCVPRCLARIELRARPGELRVVPFGVRNTSNAVKKYKVGVRPFEDAQGKSIGVSLALSDTDITIQPGKTVICELFVHIPKTLSAGSAYETDIVLREAKNNQNICLTMVVEGRTNVPVACPLDEKYLNMKFQRWYHHFYCTPQTLRAPIETGPDQPVITPERPVGKQ